MAAAISGPPPEADAGPRKTVVVLGASNVSLAWSEIVNLACRTTSHPVDLVTAQGMGRAYVSASSGFAFLRLPGILRSGLWDRLNEINADSSPSVLLTDLGNDLLYGRSVEQVLSGASACIDRIREWCPAADLIITAPPLESVLKLGAVRFQVVKRLLFPFSRLSLAEVHDATQLLSSGICDMAESHHIKLYVPPAKYFGIDPIHIRKKFRGDAFREMFDLWQQQPGPDVSSVRSRRVIPQDRLVFGRVRSQPQPKVESDRLRVFAF